jgi:hypothetical protein
LEGLFISPGENNEIPEDDFSLSELLVPDTPEIKEIKSIYEKEFEYSDYLSEIEITITAHYYEENRNLKDKDVISTLKNIKQNRDKPISFFKKNLEREIIGSLIEALEENPLTDHEFTLVIDYVLWVIDNRSWIPDKQAYVKWITYVMGVFSKEEEKKYEREFNKFARKLGVSSAQVDMLLMKRDAKDFFEEEDLFEGIEDKAEFLDKDRTVDTLETGFFLMTDDEKFDFLLDKGTDYVELVQDYVLDLKCKEDYEKIQEFYKKFIEKHEDCFPVQFIIGTAYIDKDPALANSYFEEAIRAAEKSEEIPEEMKKVLRADINQLTKLITEESAEKPEEKTDEGKKGKRKSKTGKKA